LDKLDPEQLKETKNTSILAPVYYYKIAKRDFGSTSRFFRVMMEGYIKSKYGNLIKSDDIIGDKEIQEVLICEKENEKKFVKGTLDLVNENHVSDEVSDLEAEAVISKTVNETKSKAILKIKEHRAYFEEVIKRASVDDVVPPFDYIEREYGVSETVILNMVEDYSRNSVFNFEIIF
jgi:hypothetical protein